MKTIEVHSQAEFNAVPMDFDGTIVIKNTVGRICVKARENSCVEARENSRVVARENSCVVAWENSSVVARENSRVEAWDNSSILLRDNSTARTYMNATAKMWIKPKYDKKNLLEAAEKENGFLILYKSVNPKTDCDFYTGSIKYELNQDIICPDFDPDKSRECGGGLHLCIYPSTTQLLNEGKILKCLVDPKDVIVFKDSIGKVRCRKVRPVAVVDSTGKVISQ